MTTTALTDHEPAARPRPLDGVFSIDPYVPGKSSAPGVAKIYKLSSNETPLGPSPRAIEAYRACRRHLEDYPDGAATRFARSDRPALRARSGADRLRRRLRRAAPSAGARLSWTDGDEAIHTTHGFLVYPIATLGAGAKPVVRRRDEFTADVDAILAAVAAKTKIVFLANPNNPTGTYLPFDEVKRLHAACRRMCCWCSTPPMPNMSGATTTSPASNLSRRARTS